MPGALSPGVEFELSASGHLPVSQKSPQASLSNTPLSLNSKLFIVLLILSGFSAVPLRFPQSELLSRLWGLGLPCSVPVLIARVLGSPTVRSHLPEPACHLHPGVLLLFLCL